MKKNIYIFVFGIISFASHLSYADANLVKATIAKHTHKQVNVDTYSKRTSAFGLGDCNFYRNGEKLVIDTFIKKDTTVFDVGAHVGHWTEAVLATTNSQCFIYAFEPVPNSYKSLEALKNKCKHAVFIFNVALGKEENITEMNYFFERGSDCSTLYDRPDLYDVPVKKITVTVTSLDSFARQHNITHIDFLKIDTEGAELDVLLGAHNLIKNNGIDIIQFEYGGTYPDAHITLLQVYNYLTLHKYLIFRIVPNGLVYIPVWQESLENFTYSNYLALKK